MRIFRAQSSQNPTFYCINFPSLKPDVARFASILIFILTILNAVDGVAQESKKESQNKSSSQKMKKQEVYRDYKSRSASTNIAQLLDEAAANKISNPSFALDKVQEALAISVADGNELNQAKCYLLIAEINAQIPEWKFAQENYRKAYQTLSENFSSSTEYLQATKGLGKSNLELKAFQEALNYFQEGIERTDGDEKSELQLGLSEVYYQMGNYSAAKKSLDNISVKRVFNEIFSTRLRNQRAKIEARLNEAPAQENIYSQSLNSLRSGKSVEKEEEKSLEETKNEIADVLNQQQRYDEAITLRKNSIEFNQENRNLSEVAKDKIAISKTLEVKGESTEALTEMEGAARIAETIDNPKEKANAFLALAELYQRNGKSNQALAAYRKYSLAVAEAERQMENSFLKRDELLTKQQTIEELTSEVSIGKQEDTLEAATVFRQQLIIYGLIIIVLIAGVTSYFTYRSAQASKTANQLLALKSLRSQMNPHFIFNALNSVNQFIAQQDERTANKFLSEFSQLMRLVLDNSEQDFITLSKEQEMLALYLKLEHYRFRDKFDYTFEMDEGINSEGIELPPMLIQPYIENAVWHGLRYKETKGNLSVKFLKHEKEIEVAISDDGIGRKKSTELKTANQRKHNSTGLKNINERLNLINKVYKSDYRVAIEDLNGNGGTLVRVHIPIAINGHAHP
jgi:Histidine kinase